MTLDHSKDELSLLLEAVDHYIFDLYKYKSKANSESLVLTKICNDILALEVLRSKLENILDPNDSNPMNY